MIFAREQYSDELVGEMMPLWEAHHAETAGALSGPLNPDLKMYQQCDLVGMLRIFTARQGGQLCGYQIFMVCEHLHSKDMIQATQDILYMKPEYRRGLAGYRFIKWCWRQLQEDGIHMVNQIISAHNNFGRLFQRMGYTLEDLTFSKRLQEVA